MCEGPDSRTVRICHHDRKVSSVPEGVGCSFFFLPQQVVDYDLANLGWVRLIKRREMEEGRLAVLITAAVLKRYNHTESKANSREDDQHSQHDFL